MTDPEITDAARGLSWVTWRRPGMFAIRPTEHGRIYVNVLYKDGSRSLWPAWCDLPSNVAAWYEGPTPPAWANREKPEAQRMFTARGEPIVRDTNTRTPLPVTSGPHDDLGSHAPDLATARCERPGGCNARGACLTRGKCCWTDAALDGSVVFTREMKLVPQRLSAIYFQRYKGSLGYDELAVAIRAAFPEPPR